MHTLCGTRPANRPAFGGTVPLFLPDVPRPAKSWKCPAFCTKWDFFCARAQFVTLPRCPDVNANHPIERNYGNSARFLAKIPNGTAAESPCYSEFWNAIDFCRLYTSNTNLNVGPANRPAFCRQVPLFYAKCPSKTFSRLAGLWYHCKMFGFDLKTNKCHVQALRIMTYQLNNPSCSMPSRPITQCAVSPSNTTVLFKAAAHESSRLRYRSVAAGGARRQPQPTGGWYPRTQ